MQTSHCQGKLITATTYSTIKTLIATSCHHPVITANTPNELFQSKGKASHQIHPTQTHRRINFSSGTHSSAPYCGTVTSLDALVANNVGSVMSAWRCCSCDCYGAVMTSGGTCGVVQEWCCHNSDTSSKLMLAGRDQARGWWHPVVLVQ